MQAKELYEIGRAAYAGSVDARKRWFATLAPLAIKHGRTYGVLPSLILAKAATESGFATDLYEESLEARYGIKMKRKAQKHNNIFAMNAFPENEKYLDWLPIPRWAAYGRIFRDYGPHWKDGAYIMTPNEPWKDYDSVDDCVEDWCAFMRYSAESHKKPWGSALRMQLLAIESYTPEGLPSTTGMHFEWQDCVLWMADDYDLYKYDKEMLGMFTQAELDEHIKKAYEYAHAHCHYAPCFGMPPMEDGDADCVGLAFRALYTLGYMHKSYNIDQIRDLCAYAGMKKTTDILDVERKHGIVCFQDNNNIGTSHINHVFYSLGGQCGKISKYDLGSEQRIRAVQPYKNVPVDEWPNKTFLEMWYVPEKKQTNTFSGTKLCDATLKQDVEMREYAGKGNKALCTIPKGAVVPVYGAVSTSRLNRWLYVRYKGLNGWIYNGSTKHAKLEIPKKTAKVSAPDNNLACRIGAGSEYPLFKPIPCLKNGEKVRVFNMCWTERGDSWANVYKDGYFFFVSYMWLA